MRVDRLGALIVGTVGTWLLVVAALIALSGCTASMEKYAEAIGKDPANICVSVSTPYGGGVVGRVNSPGAKMNISGGQCTLEVAPEVVK